MIKMKKPKTILRLLRIYHVKENHTELGQRLSESFGTDFMLLYDKDIWIVFFKKRSNKRLIICKNPANTGRK